jgi:hypothetical protein
MAEKKEQKKDAGNKGNSEQMKQVEKKPDKKNAATGRQDKAGSGMGKQ